MITAQRRYHKNRIVESLHLLIDLLSLLNYSFESYVTDGKNGATKAETVYGVYNQYISLSKDMITAIGEFIYKDISSRLTSNSDKGFVVIKRNDLVLQSFFETQVDTTSEQIPIVCSH